MRAHQGLQSSRGQHQHQYVKTRSCRLPRAPFKAQPRLLKFKLLLAQSLVGDKEQIEQAGESPATVPSRLGGQELQESSSISTDDGVSQAASEAAPLEQPSSQSCDQQQEQQHQQKQKQGTFYSFFQYHPRTPAPVQLPPSDASSEPAAVKPFFVKKAYRPLGFLRYYPVKDGAVFNYMSFLGNADPHGGKYFVSQDQQERFLESYFNTMHHLNQRVHIAECYQDHPYKYFQELDFPWDLDINLVLALIPKVIKIITEEACRIHNHIGPLPTPITSMRTPYKVHLNYPNILTVEAVGGNLVRKAVISRCRVELSGQPELQLLKEEIQLQEQQQEAQQLLSQLATVLQQLEAAGFVAGTAVQKLLQDANTLDNKLQEQHQQQHMQQPAGVVADNSTTAVAAEAAGQGTAAIAQTALVPGAADLDWESIIDFPHGSLRMLGSCKAPWMDSDPAWVTEKSYVQVQCVDGVWMRQPMTLAAVQQCSILLTPMEQKLYEQSDDFLEASYQSVKLRQQMLDTRSIFRRANKCLGVLQKLQEALQDGDTAAVATLKHKAHYSFLLIDPEVAGQQQQGQQEQPQQPHQVQGKQQQKKQRQRKPSKQTGKSEQHKQQQQQKNQDALEKLQKWQTSGTSMQQAAAVTPKLVRPVGSGGRSLDEGQ